MNETKHIISKFGELKWHDFWNAVYGAILVAFPLFAITALENVDMIDFGKYDATIAIVIGFLLKIVKNKYSEKVYVERP